VLAALAAAPLATAPAWVSAPEAALAAGAPAKPTGNRLAKATASSLRFVWRDRATDETRYKLRFRRAAESAWHTRRLGRNAHGYTLTGRPAATAYLAQARACNSHGCSSWSGTARGSTLATDLGLCNVFPAFSGAATDGSAADQSAWNQDVSASPLAADSAAVITGLSGSLHPDFGGAGAYGIPYVIVPGSQPAIPVRFRANDYDDDYGSESSPGPYRIPPNAPIEGGGEGDSHVISLDRDNCRLYELYNADYDTVNQRWNASSGVIWDLRSAALRADGLTSTDAAGLPIFPGLLRFDEVRGGQVNHAIRVTFDETADTYLHPATHCTNSGGVAQMGMRLRLKASEDTSGLTGDAAVIATAMKRYGLIVADNGSNWFFTGAGDSRWIDDGDGDPNDLNQLKAIPGSAFEVVASAGSPVSPCYS
jgi:hypothetical protein